MILESYIQALLLLIKSGQLTVEDIKNLEYKEEVKRRLSV
jgi:hypothetical protein